MELLAGETLADRMAREPMAVSLVIPLAVEALTALEVIHEQGLIHRDLKPANIFLTSHGVNILEFGLAQTGVAVGWIRLTQNRNAAHTGWHHDGDARYMSPSRFRDSRWIGAPICLRWERPCTEILAGTPAFSRRDESRRSPCHAARHPRGARRLTDDRVGQSNRAAPAGQEARRPSGVCVRWSPRSSRPVSCSAMSRPCPAPEQ